MSWRVNRPGRVRVNEVEEADDADAVGDDESDGGGVIRRKSVCSRDDCFSATRDSGAAASVRSTFASH